MFSGCVSINTVISLQHHETLFLSFQAGRPSLSDSIPQYSSTSSTASSLLPLISDLWSHSRFYPLPLVLLICLFRWPYIFLGQGLVPGIETDLLFSISDSAEPFCSAADTYDLEGSLYHRTHASPGFPFAIFRDTLPAFAPNASTFCRNFVSPWDSYGRPEFQACKKPLSSFWYGAQYHADTSIDVLVLDAGTWKHWPSLHIKGRWKILEIKKWLTLF